MLKAIERRYGIKPGEITQDGELSVLTARCLGSCGLAPAAVMDTAVLGKIAPEDIVPRIEKGMHQRMQPERQPGMQPERQP